ncbi:hypothetical protein PT974_09957 [Cladobotryum mycophilum]|uniref:Uncharacterized protein n=1 Tax=Cladobotryum mycophilum TaxID=491253 RepID=A0ABR0S912_9HYPO
MASTTPLRQALATQGLRTSTTFTRQFHQTTSLVRPATSDAQSEHETSPDKTHSGTPKPKISNLSVPGVDTSKHLTDEQKREVKKHNEDFEKRFDHAETAADDKVDKKFWQGGGTRKGPGTEPSS